MELQILLDELGERYGAATAGTDPIERLLQRLLSLRPAREPAYLRTERRATFEAVTVRPQRLTVGPFLPST